MCSNKFLRYLAVAALLCAVSALPSKAQFTLVSGTVTDPNGLPWACGTISAQLVNNNGVSATLNGVSFSASTAPVKLGCPTDPSTSRTPGAFTMQLADNTVIKCPTAANPAATCGTQTTWNFTANTTGIAPPQGTGPQSFTQAFTISGASQTLSFSGVPSLSLSGSGSGLPGAISATGAAFDARLNGDGATTSGQNTLTSATLNCSTVDNGKLVIVVNPSTASYVFGTGLVTQTGCNSTTVATLSANAGASVSGLNWAIGTDSNPAGTPFLTNAAATAFTYPSSYGLQLPCGTTIVSSPPFIAIPARTPVQNDEISGCLNTQGTHFILHPQITSGLLTGGTIFYVDPNSLASGSPSLFMRGNAMALRNISITSLGANLPVTSGAFILMSAPRVSHIRVSKLGVTSGAANIQLLSWSGGEFDADQLNFQDTPPGSASEIGVLCNGGQGVCGIRNSIIAFLTGSAVRCIGGGGLLCEIYGGYTLNSDGASTAQIAVTATGIMRIIGGTHTDTGGNPTLSTDSTSTAVIVDSTLGKTFAGSAGISNAGTLQLARSSIFGTGGAAAISGSGTVSTGEATTLTGPLSTTASYSNSGTFALDVASRLTSLGSTSLVGNAAGVSRVLIYAYDSAAGAGCSTSTTVLFTVSYTDPTNTAQTTTATMTIASNTGNGGATGGDALKADLPIATLPGSIVNVSTTYTIGTCTTGPSYAAQIRAL